jgi:putative ATPase
VGVDVDEARRDHQAVGFDHLARWSRDLADLDDAALRQGDVGREGLRAGSVIDHAAFDDRVVHERLCSPGCAVRISAQAHDRPQPRGTLKRLLDVRVQRKGSTATANCRDKASCGVKGGRKRRPPPPEAPVRMIASRMADLFEAAGLTPEAPTPLADRLRPQRLDEVVGQDHLLGPEGPIRRMAEARRLSSMILWGPPGTGKTTIARLLAREAGYEFQQISAVFSGVADLKKAFEGARLRRQAGQATLLFVDEIHRFNRAQQDGFLPYVESGVVTLVGATTENPSFELNGALLSRSQVFVLKRLDDAALESLLVKAEVFEKRQLPLIPEARAALIAMADGDGRYLLTLAETLFNIGEGAPLDTRQLGQVLQKRSPAYDKDREEHYNLISALHKSIRGSDPDAALYWLARMLQGGENPLFLARRLVRAAAEDIGEADPTSLILANAAKDTYDFLGSPEGEIALAQLVVHLATAPKSNAVYTAFKAAQSAARETGSLMPPSHILNAPTRLMKEQEYGAGYQYDHDEPDAFSGQNYFPEEMKRERYYDPPERGFEREIRKRLDYWTKLRRERGED